MGQKDFILIHYLDNKDLYMSSKMPIFTHLIDFDSKGNIIIVKEEEENSKLIDK